MITLIELSEYFEKKCFEGMLETFYNEIFNKFPAFPNENSWMDYA